MARTIRQISRLVGLIWITLSALAEYAATAAWRRERAERSQLQMDWLHCHARRIANLIGLRFRVRGCSAAAPLIVSNHVSYLDIVALGAVTPVRFVAKSEVRSWPWFGWLARCGGTIFIRRQQRSSVVETGRALRLAAEDKTRMVIFPEGTSTDGRTVLPFRSSLLATAVEESWPVLPTWIGYELAEGDPAREVCWWGDMTLAPHLWRLLGHREIFVTIRFGRVIRHWERKTLALELHHATQELAETTVRAPQRAPIFAKPQLDGVREFTIS